MRECSVVISESLKLQRNPDNYSFLKLGGCAHLDAADDKFNFQITRVS